MATSLPRPRSASSTAPSRRSASPTQPANSHPTALPNRSYLVESFDTNSNAPYVGVIGLPDAVERMLRLHPALNTSLAEATDDQVKLALHILFTSPLTSELADQLSTQAERESRTVLGQRIDYWTSPALSS